MYCKRCGKELSENAVMCPNCGTPTDNMPPVFKRDCTPHEENGQSALAAIALFLACFGFVTGIIFGSFFYTLAASALLLYIVGTATILPALTAVCLGIAVLIRRETGRNRAMAIVAISLAGVALLFLFICACVITGGV